MSRRGAGLVLVVILASGSTVSAQQPPGAGGIIYGPHHAFMVTAPPGWVLDNQAGQPDGLVAVFYPQGASWRDAAAVMYVNTVEPDSGRIANPAQVIRDDSVRFVTRSPGVRVTPAAPLRTQDKRVAQVRRFVGDAHGNFEAVAYISERTVTPVIVLTARSREAFEQALPAFDQLVRSYSFFTSDVRVTPR